MGKLTTLSEMQLDAIGEIMNISMGSAATAVSELLNAKVWITTPKVTVIQASELNYDRLEPAICVKIEYIKGLSGSNLMILKQDDVQLILNQLMGKPPVISPDFEFDELNISAVSEVMNQMMGASSTALSEFLGMGIDISTPTPYILSEINIADLQNYEQTDKVAAINFDLTIDGVIKSEFISVLDIDLAATLADRMIGGATSPEPIVTDLHLLRHLSLFRRQNLFSRRLLYRKRHLFSRRYLFSKRHPFSRRHLFSRRLLLYRRRHLFSKRLLCRRRICMHSRDTTDTRILL